MNQYNLDPRKAVEAHFEVLDSSTGEPLQADASRKTASQRGNEQLAAIGYKFAHLVLLTVGQYAEWWIDDWFRRREGR